MSPEVTQEQAIEWLEEQLELLGRLRNATTRDATFRQWRQGSLTVIERIWPGDHGRADRIRQVRFSPPAGRADERVTREHYERGYNETRRMLKLWISEVRHHGIEV